jgi:hypothetical protein
MAINLPKWTDCTTEQHIRAGAYRAAAERLAMLHREYVSACERWQTECAADGIDPELERDYYEIDKLAMRRNAAEANAIGFASAY